MKSFICVTCGTQFPPGDAAPERCPICEDERQYVGWGGQEWTDLETLRCTHHNELRTLEPDLVGIGTEPSIAIGQRALLVRTPEGNLLWDCVSFIDDATVEAVRALGGITAIAISHPHYYSSMQEWSRAFGAPVYLHSLDRFWVMNPGPSIRFWEGEKKALFGGLSLLLGGGHFPGGTLLHWPQGAGGRGALLSGDIIYVTQDRRYVSFMYSYPNLIPLSARHVRRIASAVKKYDFDRIYSAWWDKVVETDAKDALMRSAERYVAVLKGKKIK